MLDALPILVALLESHPVPVLTIVVIWLVLTFKLAAFVLDCGDTLVRLFHGHEPCAHGCEHGAVDDVVSHGYDRSPALPK